RQAPRLPGCRPEPADRIGIRSSDRAGALPQARAERSTPPWPRSERLDGRRGARRRHDARTPRAARRSRPPGADRRDLGTRPDRRPASAAGAGCAGGRGGQPDAGVRRRGARTPRRRHAVRLLGLYAVLAVAVTWPLARHLGSHVVLANISAFGDPWVIGWALAYESRALAGLAHGGIYHPVQHALFY